MSHPQDHHDLTSSRITRSTTSASQAQSDDIKEHTLSETTLQEKKGPVVETREIHPEKEDVISQTASSFDESNKTEAAADGSPTDISSPKHLSQKRSIVLFMVLTSICVARNLSDGLLTVGIPTMAMDLNMPPKMIYWPTLAFVLSSGCLLIFAGRIADIVGSRPINLLGCFLMGAPVLVVGFVTNGPQLIAARAVQGIGFACFTPTFMGIVSTSTKPGKLRNVGFACIGMGPVFGYGIGLLAAGGLIQTCGWRVGWYITGGLLLVLLVASWFVIPHDTRKSSSSISHRLRTEIDWIGMVLSASSLGLLGYTLGMITVQGFADHYLIALLIIAILLMPPFVYWMHRQEKLGRPTLIKNSIWKTSAFPTVCIMVMVTFAEMQVLELWTSLFFQKVQRLSALQTSVRILPSLVSGVVLEMTVGFVVHRLRANWLAFSTTLISALAPLLMAVLHIEWPYYYAALWAQILYPFGVEVLSVVGLLHVSASFPESDQSLAGAVFSTVATLGQAFGLAIVALVSTSVTAAQDAHAPNSPQGLMVGYRAGFWTCFAGSILAGLLGVVGLRKLGKLGQSAEAVEDEKEAIGLPSA